MVLGLDKVMELVRKEKLVQHLSRKKPEGVELELRVGEVWELADDFYELGIETRRLPEGRLVARYNRRKGKKQDYAELLPHHYCLLKTIESLNTPANIFPHLAPRTTLQRGGIGLFFSTTSPGYKGPLVVGAYNFHNKPFRLQLGTHILKISFDYVDGSSALYNGQWQDGRVSTGGKTEKQTGFQK